MCYIGGGRFPNSASPPITTLQNQVPCKKSIKINIITSNPLQLNIHSHQFCDFKKKKKANSPKPTSPFSIITWMSETLQQNMIKTQTPDFPTSWSSFSLSLPKWIKFKPWLLSFPPLECNLHRGRNFLPLLYSEHLASTWWKFHICCLDPFQSFSHHFV